MQKPPLGVRDIFDRALELDSAEERQAYVRRTCATAPEVRAQVEALLTAYERAGNFLESPVADVPAAIDGGSSSLWATRRCDGSRRN
jgi:hypothetical protein